MFNQSAYNAHFVRHCVKIRLLALVMGIVLLGTFVSPASAKHIGSNPRLVDTSLTIDPLPECTNAFQCDATFLAGDTVTFTGILTEANGRFIPGANVNLYSFVAAEIRLIASTVTDVDGTFKTTFKADFSGAKVAGETFKQQISEVFTLFAKYDGDDTYAASQSGKIVITVKIKEMITQAATDKKLYRERDIALIFVNFIEVETEGRSIKYGDFIDPDTIRVMYDTTPVELSKKKIGSYTFVTPPLTVGHHQLMINAEKEAYNNRAGFITVQVSGFFGK